MSHYRIQHPPLHQAVTAVSTNRCTLAPAPHVPASHHLIGHTRADVHALYGVTALQIYRDDPRLRRCLPVATTRNRHRDRDDYLHWLASDYGHRLPPTGGTHLDEAAGTLSSSITPALLGVSVVGVGLYAVIAGVGVTWLALIIGILTVVAFLAFFLNFTTDAVSLRVLRHRARRQARRLSGSITAQLDYLDDTVSVIDLGPDNALAPYLHGIQEHLVLTHMRLHGDCLDAVDTDTRNRITELVDELFTEYEQITDLLVRLPRDEASALHSERISEIYDRTHAISDRLVEIDTSLGMWHRP